MRVAIVHDWLVVSGGAEKVTRELVRTFPDADVFALVDHLNPEDRSFVLGGRHTRTTFIQHLPFSRTHHRWYLPLFPRAIEGLDLSAYDLVISSSYAVAKGVRKRPGARHVCYIHTPMRYAWVDPEGYLADHGMHGVQAHIVRHFLRRLRNWDLRSNAGVDRFIANSAHVAGRVRRFYDRDADMLLPPVDDAIFFPAPTPRTHFLAAARLVPYKRMDKIMAAFRSLPAERLIICGDGPELDRLRKDAPVNVELPGHVDGHRLVELMRGAHALICAAHEDLGLTPMEAQACGTPVIALRAGGYLETVVDHESGLFFARAEAAEIQAAVQRFRSQGVRRDAAALHAGMRSFTAPHFRERMLELALAPTSSPA